MSAAANLPADFHRILFPVAVVRHSHGFFLDGLGDEQAVEGISVMKRQPPQAPEVRRFDGQKMESLHAFERGRELLDSSLKGQLAERFFDRDFPERDDADEDFIVGGEQNRLPFDSIKARIVFPQPQDRVRIEEIAHASRHVIAHPVNRVTKVIGNPDFSLHVPPAARFWCFVQRLDLRYGLAPLGDDEGFTCAHLAQEPGEFSLGLEASDGCGK